MTTTATPGRELLLEAALRKLAIRQGVRLTHGGGDVPNGGRCVLCKAEWDEPFKENEWHRSGCLFHEDTRLAAKPAEEGWQDISTAPKDGTSFLATMAGGTDGPYWVLFWNGEAFECVASGATALINVSHWRSVAIPPSTTGEPKR